jgi:GNAT superfamily N-acetyltransferase
MLSFAIHPIAPEHAVRVQSFIVGHWGAPIVIAHGEVYEPHQLPGFVAVQDDTWVGLVTYRIDNTACEIVTLNSVRPNIGVGSALIEAVVQQARQLGCTRVWLITTNDNLHALRFYGKRDFRLVAVHRGAVDRARRLKPSIPLIGNDAIPICDEIELELTLDQKL